MIKTAVVKISGKQFIVKENDELVVEHIDKKEKEKVELDTLAIFSDDGARVDVGEPNLTKEKVVAEIVKHAKGEKIRVAKFKAKVRYRRVTGFRPQLTQIKIIKI